MIKELHVAIMKRSRLSNKFLGEKNQDNYEIQRNLWKKIFCEKLKTRIKNRTKKSWRTELF